MAERPSGANPIRRKDTGKSQLSLILDKYNFKSYINTIDREELLKGVSKGPNEVPINLSRNGEISDTLFSISSDPIYTIDFIKEDARGFGAVQNIGKTLQITFENVSNSILNIKPFNDSEVILKDSQDVQILNLQKNSFRQTLSKHITNKETRTIATNCNIQGQVIDESTGIVTSNRPFSIRELLSDPDINRNPNTKPTKKDPHLSTYQIFDESLAIGNRQTAELAVFLNMIPTIELSRCVPIISAKFSLPERIFKRKSNVVEEFTIANNADFLYGSEPKSAKETMSAYRGDTFIKKMENNKGASATKLGISTNLDIFLAPQTMVNSEEKYSGADSDFPGATKAEFGRSSPVIDKMRPFLSISSFDIDVKPTRGLLSYKTAQLEIVLHDRSRMADVAPFIKPDLFGTYGSEISVEYGWAHPDGSNPFGAIMNLMRAREKYMIVNSTFSLQETGEVKISLSLAMLGATDIVNTNIFGSPSLKNSIKAFEDLRKQFDETVSSISGKDNDGDFQSYIRLANEIQSSSTFGKDYISRLEKLINSRNIGDSSDVDDILRSRARELKNKIVSINETKGSIYKEYNAVFSNKHDPYLSFEVLLDLGLINDKGVVIDESNKSKSIDNYISFGKVVLAILGKNLIQTKRFNEVQLIFYNTNSKCSKASSVNIANLPISKEELKTFITEVIQKRLDQLSIGALIQNLSKRFIENKASLLFGFKGIYIYDAKTGNTKIPEGLTERSAAASQKEILYRTYFTDTEYDVLKRAIRTDVSKLTDKQTRALTRKVDFVPPRIGFSTEVIYKSDKSQLNNLNVSPEPVFSFKSTNREDDTILRVHIFDKANTPFQGAYDLITEGIKSDFKTLNQEMIVNREDLTKRGRGRNLRQFNKELNERFKVINAKVREGNETSTDIVLNTRFGAVKETYKKIMPSLTYGSQNSAIKNASFQTINEGRLATVFITRADRELETGRNILKKSVGIGADDLPLRVLPSKVDLTTIGCPVINFAQSMFFDFGTGTTVDNLYNVVGIKHSIGPGKFESGLTLQYGDVYGKYESRIVSELALENSLKQIQRAAREEAKRIAEERAAIEKMEAAAAYRRLPPGRNSDFIFNIFEI